MSANHESILREKAREAIRSGKLPRRPADRVLGGPGSGAACAVCAELILRFMTELELHFDHDGVTSGTGKFPLHHQCFAAWEFERTKIDGQGPDKPLSI